MNNSVRRWSRAGRITARYRSNINKYLTRSGINDGNDVQVSRRTYMGLNKG